MWIPVYPLSNIPDDCDLRLAVIEGDEVHSLVFPCRHQDGRWVYAATGRVVEVLPTHWQPWFEQPAS
jgi:hypothetical protein